MPRWIFGALFLAGWGAHVWAFSGFEPEASVFVDRSAVFLSFYVFPYQLFFIAAGADAARWTGEVVVLLTGAVLYAVLVWRAPPRLGLVHIGFVLAAWAALSAGWLGGLILWGAIGA